MAQKIINPFRFIEIRGLVGYCYKCEDIIVGTSIDDYIVEAVVEFSPHLKQEFLYCRSCGEVRLEEYLDSIRKV